MDSETLLFLLRGGHINMPERISRGLWPHPPLKFVEVQQVLAEALEEIGFFPGRFSGRENLRGDGAIVERDLDGTFVVHVFSSDPIRPNIVPYYVLKRFNSSKDAASEYLMSALHLPGKLDCWKVDA